MTTSNRPKRWSIGELFVNEKIESVMYEAEFICDNLIYAAKKFNM